MAKSEIPDDTLQPRAYRRKILFVRVSDEEDRVIRENAADAGLTVVDFIRAAVREAILARKPKRPRKA